MLPLKRLQVILLSIFIILLTTFAILLFIYLRNVGKLKAGCVTELESSSAAITLSLKDSNKWKDFIATIGICNSGNFTIYDSSGGGPFLARTVVFNISDEKQNNRVSKQDGSVLYSYSITYNEGENKANVILNFPTDVNINIDENQIVNGVFLTAYRLFRGKPYSERADELVKFDSLDSMGLVYEKN